MTHKKIPVIFIIVAGLFLTSCHDEYFKRLDLLESQVLDLQAKCDQINANIASMQTLSLSLQIKDRITKITKIYDDTGSEVIGYKLFFKTNAAITIYDGVAGKIPVIGTKYVLSEGGFFWTIQYDNGTVNFLTDASGNKIPANGSIIPFLKVVDGRWLVSYDSGKTFTDIGQATGESADTMFDSFVIKDDYVQIKLTNGTVFTIPTEAAAKKFEDVSEEVNENLASLELLTKAIQDSIFVFITEMNDVKNDDGVSIGKEICMSNGEKFTIYEYLSSSAPTITIEQDSTDLNYYWAIKYADTEKTWILNEDGQRLIVLSGNGNRPIFGNDVDTISTSPNKGLYVWTMQIGQTTNYMMDAEGHTIQAVINGGIFADVVNKGSYIEIKLADTEQVYKLYKKFSVAVDSTNFTMSVKDTIQFSYNPCGFENETVDFITQSGFKAEADTASNSIRIISPETFESSSSQVMAFFTFKAENTMTTVNIGFSINKKEDEQ